MFLLVCYGYLMLFEHVLRIKIKKKKMRKRGPSQSFLEQAKFHAEWNYYHYAAPNDIC